MTPEDIIVIYLFATNILLFVREMKRQRTDRNVEKLNDRAKADAIMKTLDLQGNVIRSMNGRVNTLGEVVEALVKLQQAQREEKLKEAKMQNDKYGNEY